MTDKEIDDILFKIDKNPFKTLVIPSTGANNDDSDERLMAKFSIKMKIEFMSKDLGLIKEFSPNKSLEEKLYTYTEKGRNVIIRGGWTKYLKRQSDIEEMRLSKENYDLQISAFQAKNPRLPYFISICGIIISFIALFSPFKGCNELLISKHRNDSSDTIYRKIEIQVKHKLQDTFYTTKEVLKTIDSIYSNTESDSTSVSD